MAIDSKFAVICTGGKQYKVRAGQMLKVEKIIPKGKSKKDVLEFEDILNGKKVTAKIISENKFPKIRVLKFRAKKRYKKIVGFRQPYSEIKIEKIS